MKARLRDIERRLNSRQYEVIPANEAELDDRSTPSREEWEAAWAEHEARRLQAWKRGEILYQVPPSRALYNDETEVD